MSSPGDAELYENGARYYDPGLGAFTQLDAVAGSAQHPSSLNRYLYAWANPATLTDPTGQCPGCVRWMEGVARRSPPSPPPPARKTHHRHTAPHRKPRPTPRYKPPSPTRLSIHWRFEAAQDRRWEREQAARVSWADRQPTHGAWLAFEGRADARAERERTARASVAQRNAVSLARSRFETNSDIKALRQARAREGARSARRAVAGAGDGGRHKAFRGT